MSRYGCLDGQLGADTGWYVKVCESEVIAPIGPRAGADQGIAGHAGS